MLGLGTLAKKVFGTPNDRKVKATRPLIEKINALEPEFEALSDEGLVAKTAELQDRATSGEDLNSLLPEAFDEYLIRFKFFNYFIYLIIWFTNFNYISIFF